MRPENVQSFSWKVYVISRQSGLLPDNRKPYSHVIFEIIIPTTSVQAKQCSSKQIFDGLIP
jgi:hypothetical protein